MLKIYQSNEFNYLIEKICNILTKRNDKGIFKKELFLIENIKINQWLRLKIAKKIKIFANIKIISYKKFFINILNKKKKNVYEERSIFKKNDIFWTLMSIYDSKILKNYPNKKYKENKKIDFCTTLSNLYIKYIFYNPEMIYLWENTKKDYFLNKEQKEHKKIWISVINNMYNKKKNFSSIIKELIEKIKKKKINILEYLLFQKIKQKIFYFI